jgi:hypothetical protein
MLIERLVPRQLYLDSWTFAAIHTPTTTPEDKLVSAALTELIDNWTSAEFVGFVAACENEVGKLSLEEGTDAWRRCEEVRLRSAEVKCRQRNSDLTPNVLLVLDRSSSTSSGSSSASGRPSEALL